MSEISKAAARYSANMLPVYRVYAGYSTARRLRTDMCEPHNRTWDFSAGVALDICTDKIDGWLAHYAGPTRLGGYLDQLSDKAWYLQITRQLVANGELPSRYLYIPAIRDVGTTALRFIEQHYGMKTDADMAGRIKLNAQAAATIAICSPAAYEYPEFVRLLYEGATYASIGSGADRLLSFTEKFVERYNDQPAAQFLVAATTQLTPLLEAA